MKKDAASLVELCITKMEDIGPERINAVCTDSASVMVKLKELIKEKFPWIHILPYTAHALCLASSCPCYTRSCSAPDL